MFDAFGEHAAVVCVVYIFLVIILFFLSSLWSGSPHVWYVFFLQILNEIMRGSYILHIPLIRPQNASKCQVPIYPKRFEAGLVELVGSCYNWPVHIAQYQQFKVKRNQPQRPRLLGLQTQAKHGLAADTLPIPQSSTILLLSLTEVKLCWA